jgi:hypothetical protein
MRKEKQRKKFFKRGSALKRLGLTSALPLLLTIPSYASTYSAPDPQLQVVNDRFAEYCQSVCEKLAAQTSVPNIKPPAVKLRSPAVKLPSPAVTSPRSNTSRLPKQPPQQAYAVTVAPSPLDGPSGHVRKTFRRYDPAQESS